MIEISTCACYYTSRANFKYTTVFGLAEKQYSEEDKERKRTPYWVSFFFAERVKLKTNTFILLVQFIRFTWSICDIKNIICCKFY